MDHPYESEQNPRLNEAVRRYLMTAQGLHCDGAKTSPDVSVEDMAVGLRFRWGAGRCDGESNIRAVSIVVSSRDKSHPDRSTARGRLVHLYTFGHD